MQQRSRSHSRSPILTLSLVLVATALGCAVGVSPTTPNGSDESSDAGKSSASSADAGKADASVKPSAATEDADTNASDDAGSNGDAAGGSVQDDSSPGACPGYALPNESGPCHACQQTATNCQPNGCFGGYYCDVAAAKCHPKPSGC